MLSIRIVSAIGGAVIASVLTIGGATAQSAASGQAGQPLALLAGLKPPHEHKTHQAKTSAHAKAASRTSKSVAAGKPARHIKLASKTHHTILAAQPVDPPAQTAADALPENAWLSQPPAPAQTMPSDAAQQTGNAAPALDAAAADTQAAPSAVVVDGQTVDVATPDQVNAIDLAADEHHDAAISDDRANAEPPAQRILAAPVHKDGSPVGSASWIAQVLAAFGGAVTAGAVAWFLIGGGPQRMYG
jgi:hypothetical protein